MIPTNYDTTISLSEGICDNDLFWLKVRINHGTEAKDCSFRPIDGLRFGFAIIASSLKGLLFKR